MRLDPQLIHTLPASTSARRKQKLVLSILDFLQTSMHDGSISDDDKEGLDVASE